MPFVLTLIAPPGALDPALVARVAAALGSEPDWLAEREAADLPCPTPPSPEILAGLPVDAVVTHATGRRKRLLLADMDSTVVVGETLDELARHAGVADRVAAITARAMNGELDFEAALLERVALLRFLPLAALDQTWAATRITPGAAELVATMRAHGARCVLVSGGFDHFTTRVAARLGFHEHRANSLEHDGTRLLGTVASPILGRDAKLAILHELAAAHALSPADTLAVGDGANDLGMIRAAGLGVAYRAKPVVAAAARARIDHADLRALLFIQGYRASEIVSCAKLPR